jgi:DNA-directed RNA polymerase subunit RPC12/RpoP
MLNWNLDNKSSNLKEDQDITGYVCPYCHVGINEATMKGLSMICPWCARVI